MSKPFLTAEWRKLVLANYSIDPQILLPWLPPGVEPDSFNGITYVSLVGFMFRETTVLGLKIPFHVNFPEVNLRFYVRYKAAGKWKRGVVFLSEIVPKYAVAFIANKLYKERYRRMPMRVTEAVSAEEISTRYEWKFNGQWNSLQVRAGSQPIPLVEGSEAEFITEHFWGYSGAAGGSTTEYQVAHPRWFTYKVLDHTINCDFKALYGPDFSLLSQQAPISVFFAEGSAIQVFPKRIL
ncbi:MAG: YqjF family protein [Pseudobacter sp.]|uniref:YqjF family protein n=1 Tax=Pseudobacter sp. TaxID=2045420 RepID=UPI003F7FE5CB